MRHTYKLSSKSIRAYSSITNPPARETVTYPEGKYRLVCALGDERAAVEISNSSKQKKGNAQLWQIHDGSCQQWYLKKNGDYYKFQNVNSGLMLDVDDGKAQNGRNVWQWTSNKTNAQNWILENAGNGYVYIRTALGNYYLDAKNAKSENGTNIQIYQFNPAYEAQKFKLVRLDAPSYYLDVNGTLDGNYAGDVSGYGTFDVYINGQLVADNVSDYYTQHPEGTYYEIKDIKPLNGRSYDGVASGSLLGTIVGGYTDINLRFSSQHTHSYDTVGYESQHPHKEYRVCSCGEKQYTGNTSYNSDCRDCLPKVPRVTVSQTEYTTDETITVRWSEAERADYYELKCYNCATGELDYVDWGVYGTSYHFSLPAGNYSLAIVSINKNMVSAGCSVYWNASENVDFSVVTPQRKDATATLYYDANGGIEPPSPQTVIDGARVTISAFEPGRKGYTFMGWARDPKSSYAKLHAGDQLALSGNTTIYAVWQKNHTNNIVLTIGSTLATVAGNTVYNDVAPLVVNDRTMLPARFVAENLGAVVQWDADNEIVSIERDDCYIELFVGSNIAKIDGEPITLDAVTFVQNGRTYCPVRFICEQLGAVVDWNEELEQVIITAA